MNIKNINNKKIVIISGPSGVGKSTITRRLLEKIDAFLSVSVTTRPKSDIEKDGNDYHFISARQFQQMEDDNQLLESAKIFGNMYGTPKEPVEKALAEGKIVIFEIDVQGARAIKKIYPEALLIFILPPSQSDLVGRMTSRARGEDNYIAKMRLDSASQEIASAWQYYDHMVINADLEQAVDEIIQIINGNAGEQNND